jgi:hypothetical protein
MIERHPVYSCVYFCVVRQMARVTRTVAKTRGKIELVTSGACRVEDERVVVLEKTAES